MHWEKSSTSQIGFYSIRIWKLNTLCLHREISEIAIVKISHLNSLIKKSFIWQFDKRKRKFFFAHRLFFNENKMRDDLFPCNAKQEINLTLPNKSFLSRENDYFRNFIVIKLSIFSLNITKYFVEFKYCES